MERDVLMARPEVSAQQEWIALFRGFREILNFRFARAFLKDPGGGVRNVLLVLKTFPCHFLYLVLTPKAVRDERRKDDSLEITVREESP